MVLELYVCSAHALSRETKPHHLSCAISELTCHSKSWGEGETPRGRKVALVATRQACTCYGCIANGKRANLRKILEATRCRVKYGPRRSAPPEILQTTRQSEEEGRSVDYLRAAVAMMMIPALLFTQQFFRQWNCRSRCRATIGRGGRIFSSALRLVSERVCFPRIFSRFRLRKYLASERAPRQDRRQLLVRKTLFTACPARGNWSPPNSSHGRF